MDLRRGNSLGVPEAGREVVLAHEQLDEAVGRELVRRLDGALEIAAHRVAPRVRQSGCARHHQLLVRLRLLRLHLVRRVAVPQRARQLVGRRRRALRRLRRRRRRERSAAAGRPGPGVRTRARDAVAHHVEVLAGGEHAVGVAREKRRNVGRMQRVSALPVALHVVRVEEAARLDRLARDALVLAHHKLRDHDDPKSV